MKVLEERILKDGKVLPGHILQVGSFLNQQIDTALIREMGQEIARLYAETPVTKVLTIEASGIAIAFAAAEVIGCPVLITRKNKAANISDAVYSTPIHSYTHGNDYLATLPKPYLNASDKVLIIDDFLANGAALTGLIDLVAQSGAELAGCAVAIEKGFQGGGDALRAKGIRVEALALIESMSESSLTFRRNITGVI